MISFNKTLCFLFLLMVQQLHIVLLVLRQYENKSYRMFVEWLIEAYYLNYPMLHNITQTKPDYERIT
jgi:hypothetical protein